MINLAALQQARRYKEAIDAATQAAAIASELDDSHLEAVALTNLARALLKRCRLCGGHQGLDGGGHSARTG
ncbi:hypothetical protein ACFPH6_49980 [Streptomyces xiangluensis]|uniref:Tetratricopeptide repeat-containing protein n=1 Tax=Streptomyces xiangluensis TaxID=2665720 RepID=A0ABV8Z842_9ACTN